MPHTYTNFLYHIVFSTKERLPLITRELKPRLYDYIGGTVRGLGGIQFEIGGVADHVHILIKFKPTLKFSDLMRELKANTSRWANKANGRFEWRDGYGAFTVVNHRRKACAAISVNRKRITWAPVLKTNLKTC